MPEMVVTATRTEKSLGNVPGSVEVIDEKEVKAANAKTVDELLKTVAGVDLQGSGVPGSAVRLNLRGLTTGYQAQNALVLVDGRRINDQYQGNVEFGLLPADNVERVEIVRGPASALYGSNAMGGVINVITKRGQETPVAELAGSTGSYDTQLFRASHGWKIREFDYFLTGSQTSTDGYMDNSDSTDRDWEAKNFTGNFGYGLPEDSEIRLFLGYYDGAGTDENSEREAQKDYQDLLFAWNWGADVEAPLRLRVYRNGEHHIYDWEGPGEGIYRQYTLGTDIQQSVMLGDRQRFTLGLDSRSDSVDIDEVAGDIDEDQSTLGVYVQNEFDLTDALQLTAGLRYDHSGDYDGELSPRAGLLYRLKEGTEVFASVNRAFRAPSLADQHARNEFFGMVFEGNPDLDPQTMMAYEVGARHRVTDTLKAEISTFFNDIDDFWDFMRDPDGVYRTRNIARVRTYGVESGLRWQATETVSTFANYTYTMGTYEKFDPNPAIEGNVLEDLARHKANIGVDFLNAKGMRAAARLRCVGPRFTDPENKLDKKLDDYAVADLRAGVPLSKHFELTLSVDNVFNSGYSDFAEFRQPGRTFLFGAVLRY
jgi:outer membrane cobalamin receptor